MEVHTTIPCEVVERHIGLFRYITAANYFSEILEWVGWGICTKAVPALGFALNTFLTLAPRARAHHKWYLQKFENYPKDRKILIPFVY